MYKTELIRQRGPWRNLEAVEFATLEWVDWFNHRRLLESIGHRPPAEVEVELDRIGYCLQPLDIVVVNTRAGTAYGQPDYVHAGCGMGAEATLYLLERGVRLTGTDGWSWDAPFVYTAARYAADRDPRIIWEGHKAGRRIGYCHLEKLHNLEALPPYGFTFACFPVKIRGASAGWTRAVAILDVEVS